MTELFNGLTFVVSAPRGEAKDAEQIIADNGGVNQKNVLAATKYLVIVGDGGAYRTKVDRANKLSVPIIKDSWLTKSVAAGKLLETEEFIWKESAEEEDKKEEETKTEDSSSSSSSDGPRRSSRSRKAVPKMDGGADEEDEVAELPAVTKAKKRNAEEAELDESPVKKKVQRTDETTSTGSEPAFEEPVVKVTVTQKKGVANVDKFFKGPAGAEVFSEGGVCWHATLNQFDGTFGVKGHNKFFIIQLISKGATFYVFTRWGRVGYDGSSKSQSFPSLDAAKRNFESKFADKTGNNWSNKANFEPYPKKYILIEMDFEGEDSPATSPASSPKKSSNISSALSPAVQDLMSLIFDVKMFDETLLSFEIDINRMPLGKISKSQLQKGYDILERMEKVLKGEEDESLSFLCNTFYSLIPHDFGFSKPPMIRNTEELQKKYDLLQTLGDIEVATQLMGKVNDAKHPLDVKYDSLDNEIEALEHDTDEWNRIITFLNNTAQYGQKFVVEEIYKVDRKGEKERFTKYDSLDNRKLLWHGSRVAVFASILNGGLKIMPHSGGRVGRGLYFADIISKSAAYCDYASNKPRLVLLNEVALGRIHTINRDDSSLVRAPPGFDSVLAEGKAMPDPSLDYSDYTLSHSGHPVIIPQGKVTKKPITSTFDHNEFLVYDADQVRMRYLLKMRW